MTCVAVIQARMTSTRLPGKVGLPLGDRTVLDHVIGRVARTEGVDRICLAVPMGAVHDAIDEVAVRHPGVRVVRGPEEDVLERTARAAAECDASRVLRVTSDCPLYDPEVGAHVLRMHGEQKVAFASTALETGFPIGLDAEVFDREILEEARSKASDPYEREHVTPYFWRRPEVIPAAYLDHQPDRRAWRLALDAAEDLWVLRNIFRAFGPLGPPNFRELERWLVDHPEALAPSRNVSQTPYQWH